MRIQVVDLVGIDTGITHRARVSARGASAMLGAVIWPASGAQCRNPQFGIDSGAARLGVFVFLQYLLRPAPRRGLKPVTVTLSHGREAVLGSSLRGGQGAHGAQNQRPRETVDSVPRDDDVRDRRIQCAPPRRCNAGL